MDAILYWNDVALEANRVSHTNGKGEQTGPPLSARALAIVHLAMYDAYVGTSTVPTDPPYLPGLTAVPGASPDAAIATAAHTTLSTLFPSQKADFDGEYAAFEPAGTASEVNDGVAFGRTVALAMLADRVGDPDVDGADYMVSTAPARHHVDPDNATQGIHAPFFGAQARCFAVTARHALDKPPLPGDLEYIEAVHQVRGKGIAPELSGTVASAMRRTPDETTIGLFWAYDGPKKIGTPPRLYNQVVRKVAQAQGNTLGQNARLFALVNTAMADAGILAWEQKYIHDLWRPVVGIREHDPSMGSEGTPGHELAEDCDPGWLPLGAAASNDTTKKNFTPPFPAYPSGHATFGAAAFQVTRLFYDGNAGTLPDTLADGLYFVSDELNGVNTDNKGAVRPRHVRDFEDGLWGMILENSISRVYLGVHWVFDGFLPGPGGDPDLDANVGGVPLGLNIAEDIFTSGLTKSTV